MKKVFKLLFASAFLLCAAFPAFASENFNRNSITGFIFNESRQPVSDVYVELLSDLGMMISRTKTSGSGFYAFRGLSDGRYGVKVLPYNTGYIEQTRSVSLISVSAVRGSGAVNEQIDFYLRVEKKEQNGKLASPGVIFAQEVPKEAELLYKEGVNLLNDKKDDEGFERLKKALEIFPEYYLALDRLGTEYVMRGYYRPAYVLLSKAIEVNSTSFSSHFGMGLTHYRLQEYDKAVKSFERSLEISANSANAHLWLGIAYLQKEKLSDAEKMLSKANELTDKKSSEVHFQLAKLYSAQKKYAESADALELFLKYNKEARDAEKIKETIANLRKKAASK